MPMPPAAVKDGPARPRRLSRSPTSLLSGKASPAPRRRGTGPALVQEEDADRFHQLRRHGEAVPVSSASTRRCSGTLTEQQLRHLRCNQNARHKRDITLGGPKFHPCHKQLHPFPSKGTQSKGLGTSTSEGQKYFEDIGTAEGPKYFEDIAKHKNDFVWADDQDGKAIELAFVKKQIT